MLLKLLWKQAKVSIVQTAAGALCCSSTFWFFIGYHNYQLVIYFYNCERGHNGIDLTQTVSNGDFYNREEARGHNGIDLTQTVSNGK